MGAVGRTGANFTNFTEAACSWRTGASRCGEAVRPTGVRAGCSTAGVPLGLRLVLVLGATRLCVDIVGALGVELVGAAEALSATRGAAVLLMVGLAGWFVTGVETTGVEATGVEAAGVEGAGVDETGGGLPTSTCTSATGVVTLPEPPGSGPVGGPVATSTLAFATGVETSAEALTPPEVALTSAAALATGVDVSTAAAALPDESTVAVACAFAAGASTLALVPASPCVETLASTATCVDVLAVICVDVLASTVVCSVGDAGGAGVESAAAVPAYASAANAANAMHAEIRRILRATVDLWIKS